MSPIVIIVFGPVVVGGFAMLCLLLGAATAGAWETVEGRARRTTAAPRSASKVAPRPSAYDRAA